MSSVNPLPATEPTCAFNVSWSGSDDAGGSGVATYNVYVSDDDGPFTLWQTATTQTSASYTGQPGHTYGFCSVATDNVGNVQATPTAAQATTLVQPTTTTSVVNKHPNGSLYGQAVTLTATVSSTDPAAGTPSGAVQFQIGGTNVGLRPLW